MRPEPAAVGEIHKIRLAAVAAGTWPAHSLAAWRERAVAAAVRYGQGFSPSPIERRALDLFPELLAEAAA
jgi:hypothetical protein